MKKWWRGHLLLAGQHLHPLGQGNNVPNSLWGTAATSFLAVRVDGGWLTLNCNVLSSYCLDRGQAPGAAGSHLATLRTASPRAGQRLWARTRSDGVARSFVVLSHWIKPCPKSDWSLDFQLAEIDSQAILSRIFCCLKFKHFKQIQMGGPNRVPTVRAGRFQPANVLIVCALVTLILQSVAKFSLISLH